MEKTPKEWYEINRAREFVHFSNYKAFPRVHISINEKKHRDWELYFFGFNSTGQNAFKIKNFNSKKQAEIFAKCLMEINQPTEYYKGEEVKNVSIPILVGHEKEIEFFGDN